MIDILIIGGGAAGMTAALYAKRAGKSVLLLEKESFGGQMATSPKIENYPSIKSISGIELANNLFDQIMDLGVEFDLADVTNINKLDDHFEVIAGTSKYECLSIICATGVKHKHLGLDKEDYFIGKGLSYCAVCDGAFYKGLDVIVIGDANSALQYALMLADTCNKVTLCMLFDKFFAEQALIDKVLNNKKIEVIKTIQAKEFIGNESLEGVKFINTSNNEELTIKCSGCFIAIGQEPGNNIYNGLVDVDDKGYIISLDTQTKTKGIYVAGDCRTKNVRQVTTAISDGAIAAVNAINYLNSR